MVKEAEANATADKARREFIEARNQADGLIHQTEKSLAEHGDKLAEADKSAAQSAVAEVRTAMEGSDLAALKAASEKLGQASMKIGEAVYKAQADAAPPGGPGAGPTGSAPDDGVVDAEFEDVDDKRHG
jgi:molecular chaperone DnaK